MGGRVSECWEALHEADTRIEILDSRCGKEHQAWESCKEKRELRRLMMVSLVVHTGSGWRPLVALLLRREQAARRATRTRTGKGPRTRHSCRSLHQSSKGQSISLEPKLLPSPPSR